MNSKIQPSKAPTTSAGDIAKYVAAGALVVAGLVVWWWSAGQWATPLRALIVIVGLVAGAAVFVATAKGKDTLNSCPSRASSCARWCGRPVRSRCA